MSDQSKAFGCICLFLITILTYTPLKKELGAVTENATLTNAGVNVLDSFFGLIWILLAVFWLIMTIYYATK